MLSVCVCVCVCACTCQIIPITVYCRVSSLMIKHLLQLYGSTPQILSDKSAWYTAHYLHRNLIQDKSNTDPSQLARLMEYVRSQVKHMDRLDSERLLTDGRIQILPFTATATSVL